MLLKKLSIIGSTLPTSNITINKKRYKVISAIFHKGEEMNRRHYTCMLRANKKSEWYRSNDMEVIKKNGPKEHKGRTYSWSRLSKFRNNFYI